MITVFYDGKCGLCSREITHYRKVAPEGIFDWQDITVSTTVSTNVLEQYGISYIDALKRLHVSDQHDKIHVGVDAFILIWENLENWRFLSKIVSLPGLRHVANSAYGAFANWRFKRLGSGSPHLE